MRKRISRSEGAMMQCTDCGGIGHGEQTCPEIHAGFPSIEVWRGIPAEKKYHLLSREVVPRLAESGFLFVDKDAAGKGACWLYVNSERPKAKSLYDIGGEIRLLSLGTLTVDVHNAENDSDAREALSKLYDRLGSLTDINALGDRDTWIEKHQAVGTGDDDVHQEKMGTLQRELTPILDRILQKKQEEFRISAQNEWKVHITIRFDDVPEFTRQLLDACAKDADLKESISAFKVFLEDENTDAKPSVATERVVARAILYPTGLLDDPRENMAITARLVKALKPLAIEFEERIPVIHNAAELHRFSFPVTRSIHVAQGHGLDKEAHSEYRAIFSQKDNFAFVDSCAADARAALLPLQTQEAGAVMYQQRRLKGEKFPW